VTPNEIKDFNRLLLIVEEIVKRVIYLEEKVGVVQLPAGSVDGDKNSDPQYCP